MNVAGTQGRPFGLRLSGGLLLAAMSSVAVAQDSPLQQGAYLAPMASYILPQADGLDKGLGYRLGVGYRNGNYAIEGVALMQDIDAEGGESISTEGGALNFLWFPFTKSLPNAYGLASFGATAVSDYPVQPRTPTDASFQNFSLTRAGGGVGYLWGFSLGRYEMALRTEALYIAGKRDADVKPGGDINAPRRLDDIELNVGLQLPLGLKPEKKPEPEPVVAVVPVADADGDGVLDDADQCPDTPAGTSVDAVGCPLPPPPCKTPAPGEKVSLAGCGTGDVIVLRGVNFEYDQARLTANAKTILDNVGEELVANPAIEVELSGHTDSRGSDAYNQRLSEQRAKSVLEYLESKGVEASRMGAVGVGEAKPVADNETEEGRELNRRVELRVTAGAAKAAVAPAAVAPVAAPAAEGAPAAEAAPTAIPAPASAPASEPVTDDLDFLN
ncbi:MAG TPA: OmpA family protein [Solimonas sp.]